MSTNLNLNGIDEIDLTLTSGDIAASVSDGVATVTLNPLSDLPVYANNAAAITGGLAVGAFYRTGADPDPVCVVH